MNNTWFKHWFPSASEQDCKAFMANMMKALQVTIQQDARMAHRAYEHMKRVIEGQD
jgi:phosphoribosylcarboxyaminoimidazole (NCAIR) mutase